MVALELTDVARAHLAGGELALAEQGLDRAIELHPGHVEAVLLRARLKLGRGSPGETVEAMEALLEKEPAKRFATAVDVARALRAAHREQR